MEKPVGVFLAVDRPRLRQGIRRLLEPEEGTVVVGEATSAEESFAKVGAQAVDVVLMDIRLTGMDGIEATRQLRGERSDLKVIMLSSFGNEYLVQAIEAGASGYILKAATRHELANGVRQVAGGQWYLDPNLVPGVVGMIADTPWPHPTLPHRQREILQLTADGMPSKEIARTLRIARSAVTRDLSNIYDVLGVNDQADAVDEAYRRGLL